MTKIFVRGFRIARDGVLTVDALHLSHAHEIKVLVDVATANEETVKRALAWELERSEKSTPLFDLLAPWIGHEIDLPEPKKKEAHGNNG